MAGPHEIALGLASVLGKPGLPNPMIVSLRDQTPESAAEVVRAVISECTDADIPLERIEIDEELYRYMVGERAFATSICVIACDSLIGEMRLFAKSV